MSLAQLSNSIQAPVKRALAYIRQKDHYIASLIAGLPMEEVDGSGIALSPEGKLQIGTQLALREDEVELATHLAGTALFLPFDAYGRGEGREQALWNAAITFETLQALQEAGFDVERQMVFVDSEYRGLHAEQIYEKLSQHPPQWLEQRMEQGARLTSEIDGAEKGAMIFHFPEQGKERWEKLVDLAVEQAAEVPPSVPVGNWMTFRR